MEVARFQVYQINLDPTVGSEIRKARPAVVVSPDEMNKHLHTVIIAPMTTTIKSYPTRVEVQFSGKKGQIALDQIRTVDKSRIIKHLGKIDIRASFKILEILKEMFE